MSRTSPALGSTQGSNSTGIPSQQRSVTKSPSRGASLAPSTFHVVKGEDDCYTLDGAYSDRSSLSSSLSFDEIKDQSASYDPFVDDSTQWPAQSKPQQQVESPVAAQPDWDERSTTPTAQPPATVCGSRTVASPKRRKRIQTHVAPSTHPYPWQLYARQPSCCGAAEDPLADFTAEHMNSVYDLIDLDEDGCVTPSDLYAFLALNPSCLTGTSSTSSLVKKDLPDSRDPEESAELGARRDDYIRDWSFVSTLLNMSYRLLSTQKELLNGGGINLSQTRDATNRVAPCFISRDGFQVLMREAEFRLSRPPQLDPFVERATLSLVRSFFRFARKLCEENGSIVFAAPSALMASPTNIEANRLSGIGGADRSNQNTLDAKSKPLQSHNTLAGGLFWMTSAWGERRGLLKVSWLQRIGEAYIRSKARKQDQEMKQFVRFYRHLLNSQTGGPWRNNGNGGRAVFANLDQLRMPKKGNVAVGEHLMQSQGGGGGGAGAVLANRRSLSLTHQEADVAEGLGGKGNMGRALGGGGAGRAVVTKDFVMHSLVEPDSFSMVAGLNERERQKIKKVRTWVMVRACVYGLVAALTIASCDVLTFYLLMRDERSLGDTVFSSFFSLPKSLFGWSPFAELDTVMVNATDSTNSTSDTLVSYSADGGWTFSFSALSGEAWKYQLIVLAVSFVVSILEIIVLYVDNLKGSYSMGKAAGMPLFHYANNRSECFMRSDEHEVAAVKESLTRKRIRFIINSISRAALEVGFSPESVLGVFVADTNISAFSRLMTWMWPKIKRSAPTFLLRVVVGRLFSQYAVPFVSSPMLVYWNFRVARGTLARAREVIVGGISAEVLGAQLLDRYFGYSPFIIRHNLNIRNQQQTATGSRAGGGVLVGGIHYAPFHVYRELVTVVVFHMRIVGQRMVHPTLHILLVYVASHLLLPDPACGYTMPTRSSRKAKGPASPKNSQPILQKAKRKAVVYDHSSPIRRPADGCDAFLTEWMGDLCADLNEATDVCSGRGRAWVQRFINLHGSQPAAKSLIGALTSFLPTKQAFLEEARVQHLLEITFPAWACPPQEALLAEHTLLAGSMHFTPFTATNIQMFVVVAVMCVMMTGSDEDLNLKERVFLTHLLRVYRCAKDEQIRAQYGSEAEHASLMHKASTLLRGVGLLRRRFSVGYALHVHQIIELIERSS